MLPGGKYREGIRERSGTATWRLVARRTVSPLRSITNPVPVTSVLPATFTLRYTVASFRLPTTAIIIARKSALAPRFGLPGLLGEIVRGLFGFKCTVTLRPSRLLGLKRTVTLLVSRFLGLKCTVAVHLR